MPQPKSGRSGPANSHGELTVNRCGFAGQKGADQQCRFGEDERTDERIGGTTMEVEEPVGNVPVMLPSVV
jgi:hypothetical protein